MSEELIPISEALPELRAERYAEVRAWDAARMALEGEYEAADGEYLRKIRDALKPTYGLWKAYYTARGLAESTVYERISRAEGRYVRSPHNSTPAAGVLSDPIDADPFYQTTIEEQIEWAEEEPSPDPYSDYEPPPVSRFPQSNTPSYVPSYPVVPSTRQPTFIPSAPPPLDVGDADFQIEHDPSDDVRKRLRMCAAEEFSDDDLFAYIRQADRSDLSLIDDVEKLIQRLRQMQERPTQGMRVVR